MAEKKDAYEHQSEAAGFAADHPSKANEHREAATPPAERNELDVKERNRDLPDPDEVRQSGATQPHGPETHQDTRTTRKGE